MHYLWITKSIVTKRVSLKELEIQSNSNKTAERPYFHINKFIGSFQRVKMVTWHLSVGLSTSLGFWFPFLWPQMFDFINFCFFVLFFVFIDMVQFCSCSDVAKAAMYVNQTLLQCQLYIGRSLFLPSGTCIRHWHPPTVIHDSLPILYLEVPSQLCCSFTVMFFSDILFIHNILFFSKKLSTLQFTDWT